MKKIVVITSGLLPMPAVKDGAIEMLMQYILDYNESNQFCNLELFSIYDEQAIKKSKQYKNTKFFYIKINKIINMIYYNFCRIIRKLGYNDPNFQYFYIKKVIKKLKKTIDVDYIIIQSDNHFAYHILKKINKPTILYLHNDKLNNNTKNSKFIVENLYKVYTVSDYLKKQVLTIDKNIEDKVSVILNGMDLSEFNSENYHKLNEIYRKKYNVALDEFVFLFVGRIEPNKGVLELVKAFNKINKKAKLIIVGGSFHSSNKKSKYYNLVLKEASNNMENIIFTGYVKHSMLNCYHAMSNALVVPSIWEEPAGLVNIEAISSKLILVASNVGGIPEYTNQNTILVDKTENFVSSLTKSLELAIDKKSVEYDDYSIEYFSKEKYCERFEKLIKEVDKK